MPRPRGSNRGLGRTVIVRKTLDLTPESAHDPFPVRARARTRTLGLCRQAGGRRVPLRGEIQAILERTPPAASTAIAVGTMATPYLRARSGRWRTSTVITLRPWPRRSHSRRWHSEQSGCVNWTTAPSVTPPTSAGSIRVMRREPMPRRRAPKPVDLAAGAEAGDRGEQRQSGDQQAEHGADEREAGRVGQRRGAQHDRAHQVGEAGSPRVLQRPLADARLQQLEVRDAGEAPAAAHGQAEHQLEAEQPEQRPPAGGDSQQRHGADHGLVDTRRVGVDDVQVAVGIGGALGHSLDPKCSAVTTGSDPFVSRLPPLTR